jgi:hypothetical protein
MSSDGRPFDPEKTPDPTFRAPDLMQAVEGWRAWGVDTVLPKFGVPPKLRSLTQGLHFNGGYWTPRKKARAHCDSCGEDVPGWNCSCGFYSAKTQDHLLSMSYHIYDSETGMFHVVGQVANWGKVVEGSQGWRSEFSYPVRLYVPFEAHKLAKPLSNAYGIPVKLKNTLKPAQAAI